MADIRIDNAGLGLVVSTAGGTIWRFFAKRAGGEEPLLREPPAGAERSPLQAGCFPLVPFGNRVSGNHFRFRDEDYTLTPNMPWDPHYLHGDGWTSEWQVADRSEDAVTLSLTHRGVGTPYAYDALQAFRLDGSELTVRLTVANRGEEALPFGLGWHPYFPLTPATTLRARAGEIWAEGEGWLPTTRGPKPAELDFDSPRPLPRRWVNNGFEDWDGRADIAWPERRLAVTLEADPLFTRCFLFVSDPAFDPGYAYDFFCFEPMSHSADAHNGRGGGLVALEPGESLGGTMRLRLV